MANVQFLSGTKSGYDALTTKDSFSFYLTTDTNQLFIGSKEITNGEALAAAVARIAQNETDISTINTTLTKLENTEATSGSIRNIIKGYFDAYRAVNLIYTDEEGTVGEEGYKPAVTVKKALDDLNAAVGSGGAVGDQISAAIGALDASVSQTASDDGLALSITEVDGVITGLTGSIAANTYDEYGAASDVQDAITGTAADGAAVLTLNGLSAKAQAAQDAADAAQSDVDDLGDLVGTIPGTATATTVVGYVDEKVTASTYDDTALAARVGANEDAIELLNKTDGTTGSVKKTVDDAIAAVVADAPASLDTLKEISDWISGHADDASAMNTQIQTNKTNIGIASSPAQGEPGDPDYVAPVSATGLHKKIEDETARAEATESALDSRVDDLEAAIGSGGSVADAIQDAIEGLDVTEFALAEKNTSTNVVTIHGVSETDGEIAVGVNTSNDITLAPVAATGAAVDVSVTDTGNFYTGSSVEGCLAEIGMRLQWQSF